MLAAVQVAMVVLSVFSAAAAWAKPPSTKCLLDIGSTADYVVRASSNIADAIYECHTNTTGCAQDISLAVTNLGYASESVTAAVKDCGGTNNTACAKDLTDIAVALGKTGTDVTDAVDDCKKFGFRCTADIAGAAVELGLITKDIIHASSDCKPSV